MSATKEWIKEQFAKESPRVITEYSLQKQIDELTQRIRVLEEDMAYKVKEELNI